jgi:hypothetical protein
VHALCGRRSKDWKLETSVFTTPARREGRSSYWSDSEVLCRAFEADWVLLQPHLQLLKVGSVDTARTRMLLASNYLQLRDVFKYYSSCPHTDKGLDAGHPPAVLTWSGFR